MKLSFKAFSDLYKESQPYETINSCTTDLVSYDTQNEGKYRMIVIDFEEDDIF